MVTFPETLTIDDARKNINFDNAQCAKNDSVRALFLEDLLADNLNDKDILAEYSALFCDEIDPLALKKIALAAQKNLVKKAKAVCATCAHIAPCKEFGLRNYVFGVAGGLTERERKALRKSLGMEPLEDVSKISRQNLRDNKKYTQIEKGVPVDAQIHNLELINNIPIKIGSYFHAVKSQEFAKVNPFNNENIQLPANLESLNEGKPVRFPDRLNILTGCIYDGLASGEPVDKKIVINNLKKFISDEQALYAWSVQNSVLLVTDSEKDKRKKELRTAATIQEGDIRVMTPHYASLSKNKRIEDGKKLIAEKHINRVIKNDTVTKIDQGKIQGTQSGIKTWIAFKTQTVQTPEQAEGALT